MTRSLVRSRTLITRALDRHSYEAIDKGAVLQEDGRVLRIGTFDELRKDVPDVDVVGSGNDVVMPGFVNGHHHVGLTPLQLGSPDVPLELWFFTRIGARAPDPYLDTLYSAFEMIASGVTTVQHINVGRGFAGSQNPQARIDKILKAYDDVGMRVSFAYGIRDQNELVYQADSEFVASLPEELRAPTDRLLDKVRIPLRENIGHFEELYRRYKDRERIRIQLAPPNLHWLSDEALAALSDMSARLDVPMHMHLVETAYQKEYARRRGNCTAVEYIDRFGMLGPRMTLGHAVWVNETDIERLAETGTCICTNCSSNFRLRSGIAPLNRFEEAGIPTCIGIDEAGINDDRDMLQEMRLVLRAHRHPGMDDSPPTPTQIFRMASEGGARTTGFGETIGRIEVGAAADMVMVDWNSVAYPYLDDDVSVLDAVVQRAKSSGVRAVICAGEVIYENGRFTRVDRDAAVQALHEQLKTPLSDFDCERRETAAALLPHAIGFYDRYYEPSAHAPFFAPNSKS